MRTPGLRRSVARSGERGQRAVTRFETVERLPRAAYVLVRPETGRTHQIRVHFAASGHPILGDKVYGPELRGAGPSIPNPSRQLLHARRLGFAHPRTGEALSVESPLPLDFREALAALRSQPPALFRTPPRPHRTPRQGEKKAPAAPALSKSRRKRPRRGR